MARFDVFWNPAERAYLLDVQSDLIDGLSTRVAVPLIPIGDAPKQIGRLNPTLDVDGIACAMMTDFISAVPRNALGEFRDNLSAKQDTILAALDMLFFGF